MKRTSLRTLGRVTALSALFGSCAFLATAQGTPQAALDRTALCVALATGDSLENTRTQVEQIAAQLTRDKAEGIDIEARIAGSELIDNETRCLIDHLIPYLE